MALGACIAHLNIAIWASQFYGHLFSADTAYTIGNTVNYAPSPLVNPTPFVLHQSVACMSYW